MLIRGGTLGHVLSWVFIGRRFSNTPCRSASAFPPCSPLSPERRPRPEAHVLQKHNRGVHPETAGVRSFLAPGSGLKVEEKLPQVLP